MSETVQYMVARDANEGDVFAHHSVGVDSMVGLFVLDAQGRELSFSDGIQEELYEALGTYLGRVN